MLFIIPDTLLKTCRNVLGGGIILDGDDGMRVGIYFEYDG